MTERARIASEHNFKKHLPAPEIPKIKSKKKPSNIYYKIEERLTEEGYKQQLEIFKRNKWCFHGGSKGPDMEWHKKYGKYLKPKDAEQALKSLEKYKYFGNYYYDFYKNYEYRIVKMEK